MTPRNVEQWLAALRDPTAELALRALAWMRPGAGIVIAAAAKHVERGDALADAFGALVGDPKRDPICRGKIAIARRLHALDHWDDRVFVGGLRIVQVEGGADSAAELRGVCGLAHAHFARADALDVLGELLADAERTTRVAAAQGLGDAGRPDASALLRYKVVCGDEPEVAPRSCSPPAANRCSRSREICRSIS